MSRVLILYLAIPLAFAFENETTIQVSPGKHTYQIGIKKTLCIVDVDCKGGTGEKWLFKISKNNGEIECHFYRYQQIYLVFDSFKMHITNKKCSDGYISRNGDLLNNQFKLDLTSCTISNSPSFKQQLSSIYLKTHAQHNGEL